MKQYQLDKNKLTMRVKRASIFIRSILFVFSILFFLLPLFGMILYVAGGNGMHIGFVFSGFIFGLMGFYLLRISLWNTYGKEEIIFNRTKVEYRVDYGWFKDAAKSIEITPLTYSIRPIGFEEDNKGALVIGQGDRKIECATKMRNDELKELIALIKSSLE